jgi:hypothetical protein
MRKPPEDEIEEQWSELVLAEWWCPIPNDPTIHTRTESKLQFVHAKTPSCTTPVSSHQALERERESRRWDGGERADTGEWEVRRGIPRAGSYAAGPCGAGDGSDRRPPVLLSTGLPQRGAGRWSSGHPIVRPLSPLQVRSRCRRGRIAQGRLAAGHPRQAARHITPSVHE